MDLAAMDKEQRVGSWASIYKISMLKRYGMQVTLDRWCSRLWLCLGSIIFGDAGTKGHVWCDMVERERKWKSFSYMV